MNARALLEELRRRNISVEAEGDRLRVEVPAGADTEELRAALSQNKPSLIQLLRWENPRVKRAERRDPEIRWSEHPVWIALWDPDTREWHEIRAAECLPGIVKAADAARRREGGG